MDAVLPQIRLLAMYLCLSRCVPTSAAALQESSTADAEGGGVSKCQAVGRLPADALHEDGQILPSLLQDPDHEALGSHTSLSPQSHFSAS